MYHNKNEMKNYILNSVKPTFSILLFVFLFTVGSSNAQVVSANRDSFYFVENVCDIFNPTLNDTYSGKIFLSHTNNNVAAGTLTFIGNLQFEYCPTSPVIGLDSFQYTICDTDFVNCKSATVILLNEPTQANHVWPGDVNNDGIVNHKDLLIFPNHVGVSGKSRNNINTFWKEHQVLAWSNSFLGVNGSHYDADGDGQSQLNDTFGILSNYGKTHPLFITPTYAGFIDTSSIVPIKIELEQKNLRVGDTLRMNVLVGSNEKIAKDLIGLSYSIKYDTAIFGASTKIGFDDRGSWLTNGSPSINRIFNHFENKSWDVVNTRLFSTIKSGIGSVGSIIIIIDEIIIQKIEQRNLKEMVFEIQDAMVIGNSIPKVRNFNLKSDTLQVVLPVNEINDFKTEVSIYPNPFASDLFLSNPGNTQLELELYDVSGRVMMKMRSMNSLIHMDVSDFSKGLYILKMNSNNGSRIIKITKN